MARQFTVDITKAFPAESKEQMIVMLDFLMSLGMIISYNKETILPVEEAEVVEGEVVVSTEGWDQ